MEEKVKTKNEVLKEFFNEVIEDVLDAMMKSTSLKLSAISKELLIKRWSERILRREVV
jgi:hypothetical protein